MLIRITNTAEPATDLGFLLHKNPANLHSVDLAFGKAHVFYSSATPQRCTACLLVELDPVELVRGGRRLEEYVNDRPYVSSSYLTVAMGRVFGTALAGNCQKRPDLVHARLPLEVEVEVIRLKEGGSILKRLFEPLGYRVEAARIPLDDEFPEWGESEYLRFRLVAKTTVHDCLSHLYVLLPVLDDAKHYFIGEAEVDKLLRHGEGWLRGHPEREFIVQRYLKRKPALVDQALASLLAEEVAAVEAAESAAEQSSHAERDLERPMTLSTIRLNLVASRFRALGARSVVDLGCGEGKLLRRLLADQQFEQITGMDVSHRALETAARTLDLNRMPEHQRKRIRLMQGSLLYRDKRLNGFDAAALVEVIEHLDRSRLAVLERVVFEFARPRYVIVTTPNREYNALFPELPPGALRHDDHRFEWNRAEFKEWAETTASRFGYSASLEPVGPVDDRYGAPCQMAVFSLKGGAAG
ncbi:MAG: 3' terminal RNA ribose 2'-O-methyltransferase Hen1 [Bryobacteraceae bacterium]|nr:3' terminal RNA ribose 2'-O-methyltransferase Hen1 [Bryobacteraceae bacterium]